MPEPPPGLPGVVACPPLARACATLGITPAEADERLGVEDVLDLNDLALYLHDVDAPPAAAPTQTVPGRR
jgi:hypothetical protein